MRNKIISIILCITMLFTLSTLRPFVPTAYAWWGFGDINWDVGNFAANYGDWITQLGSYAKQVATYLWQEKQEVLKVLATQAVEAAKVLALIGVQKMTAKITGQGNGLVIRDWKNYLYNAPAQMALKQMNTFYNTASKGRLSSLNYEGASGTNTAAYFVSQSKQTIAGTPFQTNIQEKVPNPKQNLFSTGNLKGLMSTTECANNVACFTLAASTQYNTEVAKNKEVAKAEQQNGILPTKTASGRIDKPAALISSSLMQVDQMGTKLIMSADSSGTTSSVSALAQIAEGAALSLASRVGDYYAKDALAKSSLNKKLAKFPFSSSYSK